MRLVYRCGSNPGARMSTYLFDPLPQPALPVVGERRLYPVSRIFCVGRNYADHAREMGHEVDREAPFYFTKPASALVRSGEPVPYAPGTRDLHHEMELVVAIGRPGFRIAREAAMGHVYGYACGLDMTRRDLQAIAKQKARPWDLGKAFEQSAIMGPLTIAAEAGPLADKRIALALNGETRQEAVLSDMVWSVEELIADLSLYYHLAPGDLIFTGTPAGVGAVQVGDRLTGTIDGLAPVEVTIGEGE
jgi:fumarylpyruvate hydrolase